MIAPAGLLGFALVLADQSIGALIALLIALSFLALVGRLGTTSKHSDVRIEMNGMSTTTIVRFGFVRIRRNLFVPWSAIKQIRVLRTHQMPLHWRVSARLWGYAAADQWVEMRGKGMLRVTKSTIESRGFGFPLFTRGIYLRPEPLAAFIAALTPNLPVSPR